MVLVVCCGDLSALCVFGDAGKVESSMSQKYKKNRQVSKYQGEYQTNLPEIESIITVNGRMFHLDFFFISKRFSFKGSSNVLEMLVQ